MSVTLDSNRRYVTLVLQIQRIVAEAKNRWSRLILSSIFTGLEKLLTFCWQIDFNGAPLLLEAILRDAIVNKCRNLYIAESPVNEANFFFFRLCHRNAIIGDAAYDTSLAEHLEMLTLNA